jgi:hypothetical protein
MSKTKLISSNLLIRELAKMHNEGAGWQFVDELRVGTGYGAAKEQRFDAWAIQAWDKGVSNLRRAFEVKVSEADLRKELLNADKRWYAKAFSHEFYFVTPAGLCDKTRLDDGEGLIEWDGDGKELRIVKRAKRRDAMPPRWDFVASLVRSISKQNAQG